MTAVYAELDLITNFSFLEGGSHPAEMVVQARALGLAAIGIADRNTLAGVVRAHKQAKKDGYRILIGCRLAFQDGTELIVYPRDRAAYGRLCRLLSLGKSRIEEGPPPFGGKRHEAIASDVGGVSWPLPPSTLQLTLSGHFPHKGGKGLKTAFPRTRPGWTSPTPLAVARA